ncbi:hypothetical protein D3C74_222900 [compost metagenome]
MLKVYSPILKWKAGEQKALELLSDDVQEKLIPIIEIPPIDWDFDQDSPKKTIDEHLFGLGTSLHISWRQSTPLLIDIPYLEPLDRLASGQHPLSFTLDEIRKNGLSAIPVTSSDKDIEYHQEAAAGHVTDGLGVAIRIKESDFDDMQYNIDSILSVLKIDVSKIDLIVDYGYVEPETKVRTTLFLTGLLNSIPYLDEWRSLTLNGTAMPKDLSDVGRDTIDEIERSEWIIWKKLLQNNQLKRMPNFGDYAIANPAPFEADPRLIRMSANIRYTGDDKYIIFKGRDLRKYGHGQYFTLASQVINHDEYRGTAFSAGDYYIEEVGLRRTNKSGSPTTWRRAATNHHLTLVVTELSNVSLI